MKKDATWGAPVPSTVSTVVGLCGSREAKGDGKVKAGQSHAHVGNAQMR